jgi:hypothetical protein
VRKLTPEEVLYSLKEGKEYTLYDHRGEVDCRDVFIEYGQDSGYIEVRLKNDYLDVFYYRSDKYNPYFTDGSCYVGCEE